MWELKLKEKPIGREFITIWNKEFEERAVAEFDKWNHCPDTVYAENKTREDLIFRKKQSTNIESNSSPQGRLTREGVAMAKYKRQIKE